MAKDPAFLFYPGDFLTGCAFLSKEDRGRYITVLCLLHQHGRLDKESFEKAIGLPIGLVSVKLMQKFSLDENGLYFNARLEEEIAARAKFTESRRNNGSLGGRPKIKEKPNGKPKKNLSVNLMEDENENVNESIIVDNNVNAKFKKMLLESESVLDTVCYILKISTAEAEHLREIFTMQAEATNEHHNNYADYSKHFINWAKLNKALISDKPKGKITQAIDTHAKGLEIIKKMRNDGLID